MKQIFLYIQLMALFLILPVNAYAICVYQPGSPTSPVVANINVASNYVVQRDAPPGTLIATVTQNLPSDLSVYECDSSENQIRANIVGSDTGLKTGNSLVYSTNVAGIGYAISYNDATFGATQWPITRAAVSASLNPGVVMSVRFVVTGGGASGQLASGQYGRWTIGNVGFLNVFISNTPKFTRIACSITTPNLTFPIGDVLAASFGSTVGTTPTGAQNTQNLGLNCDAGANINVSLGGTQNPDVSTTSVLALTGQGNADVAKGVGVQILYNGTPLVLNNRIVLKQSAGGQETFPLTARYYQTKTAVTTGTANASATLDLTYQ